MAGFPGNRLDVSAEEYLAGLVDRKDRLAVGAAKAAGTVCAQLGAADRAAEGLGEHIFAWPTGVLFEVLSGISEGVPDIEKLRKAEQLEHLVDFGLDFQEHKVAASRFDRFQKRCE